MSHERRVSCFMLNCPFRLDYSQHHAQKLLHLRLAPFLWNKKQNVARIVDLKILTDLCQFVHLCEYTVVCQHFLNNAMWL